MHSLNYPILKYAMELGNLMDEHRFHCLYQPIVSLTSGGVMGWEALLRGPEGHYLQNPDNIFQVAEGARRLVELEAISHQIAVAQLGNLGSDQKLFLNVHPHVIQDGQYDVRQLADCLTQFGMAPHNIVFEITERQYIENYELLNRKLDDLRNQGFSVAVDDLGSGCSGLQSIAEIRPEFLKIDMSLIRDIHDDRIKQALVEMFVLFSEKMGSEIVAEGIETEKELSTLMKMNVHFGQGFLIGKPALVKEIPADDVYFKINRFFNNDSIKMMRQAYPIGDITEEAVCVDYRTAIKDVKSRFEINPALSGVVVMEGNRPVGLVMRQHLDGHLGKKFGVSLYYDRSIGTLMDRSAVMVDETTAIEKVSQLAMNRKKLNLYDHIIVTSNRLMRGIVSVQTLLEIMTRIRVEMAKGANPLTGLPGNLAIENELRRRQNENIDYSVVFVDLDHFKSLNDRYGFEVGDAAILFTANLLRSLLNKFVPEKYFLGHIGGDDYIFCLPKDAAETICRKTMRYFDYLISRFYDPQDVQEGCILSKDRDGQEKWIPIITISMAILDVHADSKSDLKEISTRVAQLKKYAKSLPGSVYVRDRRDMNTPEAVERSSENHASEKNDHHGHLAVNNNHLLNRQNTLWPQ